MEFFLIDVVIWILFRINYGDMVIIDCVNYLRKFCVIFKVIDFFLYFLLILGNVNIFGEKNFYNYFIYLFYNIINSGFFNIK